MRGALPPSDVLGALTVILGVFLGLFWASFSANMPGRGLARAGTLWLGFTLLTGVGDSGRFCLINGWKPAAGFPERPLLGALLGRAQLCPVFGTGCLLAAYTEGSVDSSLHRGPSEASGTVLSDFWLSLERDPRASVCQHAWTQLGFLLGATQPTPWIRSLLPTCLATPCDCPNCQGLDPLVRRVIG